ncbi:hypothetical protein EVAR_79245_1 [Eumeta japonica]|uniref:Uncharacterized protein n=1 Tax=Eumeta variegata TaxID=151549 RepID=A0A4C1TFM2_EUMVA|nr:hypothetical protein EVAR_79245_1 [Eumeta japonica]
MDDAWRKSSRHRMSRKPSRVGSFLPPAEAVSGGRVEGSLGGSVSTFRGLRIRWDAAVDSQPPRGSALGCDPAMSKNRFDASFIYLEIVGSSKSLWSLCSALSGVSEDGRRLVNGPLEGRRVNRVLLFYFRKSAVSSANNASWTPDDGRGISFVYAGTAEREGGALRNSCSDKTSCRTCVPYPIEGLGYIKEDSYGATFGFKAPRHTLLSGGLAVDKNGLGESRTVHL